jgi:hypothetical protein
MEAIFAETASETVTRDALLVVSYLQDSVYLVGIGCIIALLRTFLYLSLPSILDGTLMAQQS